MITEVNKTIVFNENIQELKKLFEKYSHIKSFLEHNNFLVEENHNNHNVNVFKITKAKVEECNEKDIL
jgi:hypothetical protein